MLVINWKDLLYFDKTFFSKGSSLSIGSFDGLHLGHKALFNRMKEKARLSNLLKGVFTFSFPPRYTLSLQEHKPIYTLRLKQKKMKELSLDFIVLVDFSLDFAKISGEDFVELLKRYLNIKYLLVGEDFRFGAHRASSIEDILKICSKLSFSFEVFPSFFFDDEKQKVSSTVIRQAVYEGDILFANSLLGESYSIDLFSLACYMEGYIMEEKREVRCKKTFINQVLPKEGRFRGELCFSNSKDIEEVDIVFDEVYLKMIFRKSEINRAMPCFDILKLTEKIT